MKLAARFAAIALAPAAFAAALLPAAQSRLSPQQELSKSRLKQLAVAMTMYSTDWDDFTPYAQDTKSAFGAIFPYTKDMEHFRCPNPKATFLFNMAVAGVNLAKVPAPAQALMFYESQPWPDGRRNAAFADTHVKTLAAAGWATAAKTLRLKIPKHGKPLPPRWDKVMWPGRNFFDGEWHRSLFVG